MTKSQKIRDLLAKHPNMSAAQIAEKAKASVVTVYSIKAKLRADAAEPEVSVVSAEPARPVQVAIARQVAGDHYTNLSIQPWEVIESNEMGFFDGNALKYIMRFRAKGGVEDLEKARHYLDKLIELENGRNA
jgi:hypothetical protein